VTYSWDFSQVIQYFPAILRGFAIAALVTKLSGIFGIVLAVGIVVLLQSPNTLIRGATHAIATFVRAVPLLISLVFVFYFLPVATGLRFSPFWVAVFVLSMNFAAFASDILRGGLRAIPAHHVDISLAIGHSRASLLRHVLIPETFRRSFAAVSNLIINQLKAVSVASVIGLPETLRTADLLIASQSGANPLELYLSVALLYAIVVLFLSIVLRRCEQSQWIALEPVTKHD